MTINLKYDVNLPDVSEMPHITHIKKINISQKIPPNDVDRFQFKVGTNSGIGSVIYQLQIDLLYNTGDKQRISSDEILLEVSSPVEVLGATYVGDQKELKCVKENLDNILYMIELSGIKSPKILELTKEKSKLNQNKKKIEEALGTYKK